MHPLPSLADCHLHGWLLNAWCASCRMGRSFQAREIADLQLSVPKLWDKPLDQVMDKLRCRRCGRPCTSLKVERLKDGCGNRETVLELARS